MHADLTLCAHALKHMLILARSKWVRAGEGEDVLSDSTPSLLPWELRLGEKMWFVVIHYKNLSKKLSESPGFEFLFIKRDAEEFGSSSVLCSYVTVT